MATRYTDRPTADMPALPSAEPSTALPAPGAEVRPWYLGATPLATRPWLVRMRWLTAALEGAVVGVTLAFPQADFPLHRLAPLMGVAAVVHGFVALELQRGRTLAATVAFTSLVLDVLVVTGLLELTGGPFNPFSVLYAVHIALAAVTFGRPAAWAIAALVSICYGLLIFWHARDVDPGHHRLNDFPTHLLTIWIAMATTAELVAHFVLQASNALSRREEELERMRARAARSERLIALTTLAAGAAHELSTPLATIALASRELEHAAEAAAGSSRSALVDDARLIRAEVDRCQAILDQMSGRAGGIAADHPERVDIGDAIAEVAARLSHERASRLQLHIAPSLPPVYVPRAGLMQVLLSLVTNAFDASPDGLPVRFVAEATGAGMRLSVHDEGQAVEADVLRRAGEPFYTTKEPGRGLGLGLFLARVFAERSGGSLTLVSDRGTTATLELPLRSGAPHDANTR